MIRQSPNPLRDAGPQWYSIPMRAPKATKRGRGRPSLYPTKVAPKLKRIREATAQGATRKEIARICGISTFTLSKHSDQFLELSEALRGGDSEAVALVEAALFKRAMGYSHPAVKIMSVPQGDGMGSAIEKVEYTEHYPPDTPAIEFFLSNRDPEHWKRRVEHAPENDKPWPVVISFSSDAKA